ncbi:MAG TPA: transposase, partial [Deltaproteobacteria bacterium]|nr:transposase [Deltaproteobacteria bacterium]
PAFNPIASTDSVVRTDAIESLNISLRKVIKTKSSFPNDDALKKILYLALKNIEKKWTMPVQNWSGAINQFLILSGNRVPLEH